MIPLHLKGGPESGPPKPVCAFYCVIQGTAKLA